MTNIEVVAGDGFKLKFDTANGELETPLIPKELGFPLALSLLFASKLGPKTSVTVPAIGGMTITNLEDAGALILAFYPGSLATGGFAELLALLGLETS